MSIHEISKTINLHLSFSREVQDLVDNGYLFLVDSALNGGRFVKLRHCNNGRTLVLKLLHDEWFIRDGKKIIKHVIALS